MHGNHTNCKEIGPTKCWSTFLAERFHSCVGPASNRRQPRHSKFLVLRLPRFFSPPISFPFPPSPLRRPQPSLFCPLYSFFYSTVHLRWSLLFAVHWFPTMSNIQMSAGLLKALLARVPLILKTVLLHGMRLSPVSGKQDLRTELTVVIIRSFINFFLPIGVQQKQSMRDPGIKGPMWVSKVTLPAPEDAVQDALFEAIEDLKEGDETFDIPGVKPVEAEWTRYRSGVDKNAPQPDISEEEKYEKLLEESQSDTVILYFHGGAYL